MTIIFKDIRIIDSDTDRNTNILLSKNTFKEIKDLDLKNNSANITNGKGLALLPSFLDLHCHLRDPGYTNKEDLESGNHAALAGGFTTICCMANTKPVCDNPDIIKYIIKKGKSLNMCDIIPVSAVTKGLKSKQLVNFKSMTNYTRLFSNDGEPIADKKVMIDALQSSSNYNFKLLTHCEPEVKMIERDLELLRTYGGNLHICHVSKKESIKLIRSAKKDNLNVTCEITPHHLFSYGLDYIVHPPFREKEDTEELLKGVLDGTIDIIATDHAPHCEYDKKRGARGLIGLELAFSLVYTIFKKNNVNIKLLSKLMSETPSKMLNKKSTKFNQKTNANFVLVDLAKKYIIGEKKFKSKSKNTPFIGHSVYGEVLMTIKNGEIKYDNRQTI
jgi:dihydroorotase